MFFFSKVTASSLFTNFAKAQLAEAAIGGDLSKKLFLKLLQYSQETPVLESLFNKVAGLATPNADIFK